MTATAEYPKLYTIDWVDDAGHRHTWSHRIEGPPTEDEVVLLERACETCGINAAIAALVDRGHDVVSARQKVFSELLVGLATRSMDEAGYRRECERRGLLPL